MAEQSFAVPSFEIDDNEETTTTTSTVPAASTTSNVGLVSTDAVPSFEVDDTDDAPAWETDKLDVTEEFVPNKLDVDQQTAAAILLNIPVQNPNLSEEIDARIQRKFEEQRNLIAANVQESEYANLVAESHAEDLKFRMEELDRRGLTVQQAREMAAERGGDALATFESNFAEPKQIGQERLEETEEWAETARDRVIARLNTKNMITSGITDQLLDGPFTLSEINALVLADEMINPATSFLEVPIHYANFQEALNEGRYWAASGNLAMIAVEITAAKAVLKPVAKGVTNVWKYAGRGKQKGYDTVQLAMKNEAEIYNKINAANKVTADANAKLRSDYIIEYEARINEIRKSAGKPSISISKQDEKTGLFTIDPEKTREQGSMVITDAYRTTDRTNRAGQNVDEMDLEDLSMGVDNIAIPILKPEKLDALIAIAASLKKAKPDSFKRKKGTTLIDNLFELTVDQDLLASDELLDLLNKHGMSYEEYILGVVGSGSEAGRLLGKLGQIGRVRPKSLTDMRENQKLATEQSIAKLWNTTVLRVEGARRGILVSSWATTARNITTGGIIQPMASLANLADAMLIAGRSSDNAAGAVYSGVAALGKKATWKGSFSNLVYIFKDQEYAKAMTDYILKYPELSGQYKKMFDGIGEIQSNLGRGQAVTRPGKVLDGAMSKIEDGVQFLNTPNRWQDHVMRRGTFVAELERRVQLEYGQDLQQLIKDGRIQEIINDTSSIRPDGAPSFLTLVEDSTKKSMDITFAGTPNNKLLENISNGIVKSGIGTLFIPFPRFMMTSLEWMGDHTTGAFQVPLRKMLLKSTGNDIPEKMRSDFSKLTPVQFSKKYKKTKAQVRKEAGSLNVRDREQITKNLVGWATMGALYNLRTSEDMSSDHKRFTLKSKDANGEPTTVDLDTTAQYPIRQMSWVVEYLRNLPPESLGGIAGAAEYAFGDETGNTGTVSSWQGMEKGEVLETFLGLQARTGSANIFIDEIANFVNDMREEDIENSAAFDRVFGRFIGQYAASFLVPLTQIITAQRAMGIRDEEMKDHSSLYDTSDFSNQLEPAASRSFNQGEVFLAPSVTNALEERETIAKVNPKRVNQGMKLFFGLNYYESDSGDIEFLKEIGWTDPTYSLGSKKVEKPARNYVNKELGEALSEIVLSAKEEANEVAKEWKTSPALQREYTSEKAVYQTIARQYIADEFKTFKSNISKEADGELTELALILRKYKALTDTSSRAARVEFIRNNDRPPRMSSIDDVDDLVYYGQNTAAPLKR
jgi:hypothetical protein